MRGCVCVYLSAVLQSELIRLKAYLTMNSLLKSHSSTCSSFLELILAQQELYLKVTAEYWMLSRKVDKIRQEAWSLLVISTLINQCVHEAALMQKNRTKQNSLCKGPEEGKTHVGVL